MGSWDELKFMTENGCWKKLWLKAIDDFWGSPTSLMN